MPALFYRIRIRGTGLGERLPSVVGKWGPRCRQAALTLIILVLVLAGVSCGDSEPAVEPEEILTQAVEAMGALQSFHFEYQVEKPPDSEPVEGTEVVAMRGDVSLEGNMRATVDVSQQGLPMQLEFVAIGDTHHIKNPLTGNWQTVEAAESPVGSLDLGRGTIAILEHIMHPEYVTTDKVDGTETYHLRGEIPAEELAGIAGAVTADGPFRGDIWVGTGRPLVYRIAVEGAATDAEPAETTRTILLSDFDAPITIDPPG